MSLARIEVHHGRLCLEGDITVAAAAMLWPALLDRARRLKSDVVVDVGAVTALDTAGIQLLLMIRRLALSSGRQFALCNADEALRQTLAIAGCTGFFAAADPEMPPCR
jgi:anti-anti-sigma factor